jgi:hypothetical protein
MVRVFVFSVVLALTFGIYSQRATQGAGAVTISGSVFNDENGNGRRDSSEAGAPGFQVHLYRAQELGFPTNKATTDSSGHFALIIDFSGKVAQSERLLVVADDGYAPQGYVWRSTTTSNLFAPIPNANDLRPLKDGATFDIVFGKQLVQGSPPVVQLPGQITSDQFLRDTPPPKPGGFDVSPVQSVPGVGAPPAAGDLSNVTRLPSTGTGPEAAPSPQRWLSRAGAAASLLALFGVLAGFLFAGAQRV